MFANFPLEIKHPNVVAVCDGTIFPVTDTRTGVQSFLGQPLPVSWVEIEEVDPACDTVRIEAQSKGAALFSRGEGMWYGDGLIYFVVSGGGDQGNGPVWAYDPRPETVTLLVERFKGGQNPIR